MLIFIVLHSFIHLLGFVKAFQLAQVPQLSKEISKTMGILWLLAFVLFVMAAYLILMQYSLSWVITAAAILVSQILIFSFWSDARFGTIANVIVLLLAIQRYGSWNFNQLYQNDLSNQLIQQRAIDSSIIEENDLSQLPIPVKNYLIKSGVIGKPKVNYFKVKFKGQIRKNDQSEWMPFTSEQYNFMRHPTRLFYMKAEMKNMPVNGYHCYKNGLASMDIRLLSLIRVQYMEGNEMNEAETVTFFNDMCIMAPATLIDSRIKWLEIEPLKVKASFTVHKISIEAWLYFNEMGELINFSSNNRYNADAGRKLEWWTPIKNYKSFNGFRLAENAETIYSYPEGDQCYGQFTLTHIEYH